jgi:hypothetical protein
MSFLDSDYFIYFENESSDPLNCFLTDFKSQQVGVSF